MQRAAQKVLWENAQLRDLLASKGVSSKEISAYLKEHEPVGSTGEPKNSEEETRYQLSRSLPVEGDATQKKPGNTMSCENAASIIAGMRGHNEDDEAVRKELGCASRQTCEVKNVHVLQVMEME